MESIVDEQEMTQEEREASADFDPAEDGAGEAPEERKTLADLAAQEPEAEGDDEPEEREPQLFGTERKITGSVKGVRQATSSIKFKAAPVTVSGQFQPDDMLELRVLARLDKVEFTYTRDRDGNVKGVKRVHHASATSVEQVPDTQMQAAIYERAAASLSESTGSTLSGEDLAAVLLEARESLEDEG
jgi:hypothetical protein